MNFFDLLGVLLMSFVGNVLGVFFWMWMEKGAQNDNNCDCEDNSSSK